MSDGPISDPRALWLDLSEWKAVGMAEPVYRVRTPAGIDAYVRPDDGSAPLLRRLAVCRTVPAPEILDVRDGWLLLRALPGVPLHNCSVWHHRPTDVARIIAEALRSLERADLTHGDLCLPNILGDPRTGHLTGIVDWRYAERFDREIDVGAAMWSCGFNGYGEDVAIAVLRGCAWPVTDAWEVARLIELWRELTDPHAF
jgi:aminoglycoside phosphotransferase